MKLTSYLLVLKLTLYLVVQELTPYISYEAGSIYVYLLWGYLIFHIYIYNIRYLIALEYNGGVQCNSLGAKTIYFVSFGAKLKCISSG